MVVAGRAVMDRLTITRPAVTVRTTATQTRVVVRAGEQVRTAAVLSTRMEDVPQRDQHQQVRIMSVHHGRDRTVAAVAAAGEAIRSQVSRPTRSLASHRTTTAVRIARLRQVTVLQARQAAREAAVVAVTQVVAEVHADHGKLT